MSVFKENPRDVVLRHKLIELAVTLPERPAIPEAARQLFVLGSGKIKDATTAGALDEPIGLLLRAVDLAPWWGDAYYNLSRALELKGDFDNAIAALNNYLALKPSEADANEASAHIVVLQTQRDIAAHKQN